MALAIGSDFALFSTQSECLKLYWTTPFSSSDWHKIKEDKKKRLKNSLLNISIKNIQCK